MRLDELTGVKQHLDDPHDALSMHGFIPLGSGTMATVYEHPGLNYVLKVFKNSDKEYKKFYNLASEHQNNIHFPKFKGKLVRINRSWSGTRMERLEEDHNPPQPIGGLHSYASLYADSVCTPNSPLTQKFLKQCNEHDLQQVNDIGQRWPEFTTALKLIGSMFSFEYLDFHAANIMSRDGVPVITDPAA